MTLALPVVAGSLLERSVTTADIFLVGGLGADSIAAVGLSQLIIVFVMSLIAGLSVGTTVVIAQLIGADKKQAASQAASSALGIALLLSFVLSAFGLYFRNAGATLLGAEPRLVALVDPYLFFIFLFLPFSVAVDLLVAIMHGRGDTRTPLSGMIGINLLHIAIAYLLIYGTPALPAMGVKGAAVAVGLSEIAGTAYLAMRTVQKGYLKPVSIRLDLVRQVLRVGFPLSIDRVVQQLSQMAFARAVLVYGTVAYAAHQVGLAIESFSFMAGSGFAVAAVTAVGQSIGASQYQRAKMENWEANRLAVLVMSLMGILFFFFPYLLLRFFTQDPQVIVLGTLFLKIAALIQIPLAVTMVLTGSLKGAGDTRFLLGITLIGACLIRVPVSFYFAFIMPAGIVYVWSVMVVDWFVRMALTLVRYRSEKWRAVRVIEGT